MYNLIIPDWPAPPNIKAFTTTRLEGASKAPYDSFNLSPNVGDDHAQVKQNLKLLRQQLNLPHKINWLNQVHSTDIVLAENALDHKVPYQADGMLTTKANTICAVLTADCLPLLLCDQAGSTVIALHAGWRGLADGIIQQALAKLNVPSENILAWLGPAIGPGAFEVATDVLERFVKHDSESAKAFTANGPNRWLANIYQLATHQLQVGGVNKIYGGQYCTYTDQVHFYSYRRDGKTGRMATLIWLEED